MKSKTTRKSSRETTSAEAKPSRRILGPPCPASVKHLLEAAACIERAEAAKWTASRDLPESVEFHRPYESHLRDELWDASNRYRKSKIKLEAEFRARWFVWRAALPISIIIGVKPIHIFSGGLSTLIPRALSVWIASGAGGLNTADISDVIGRGRATVLQAIKMAEIGVAKPGSAFYKLMTDLLNFEAEYLWASKESSPPRKQE